MKAFRTVVWAFVLAVGFALFIWWQNNGIVVTQYTYESEKVGAGLVGFRFVHISDLHNKDYGEKLVALLAKQQPDLIVVTGDLIDNRSKDIEHTFNLLEQVLLLAPVYYVPGNNEERSHRYEELAARLTGIGVVVLENKAVSVVDRKGGGSFNLLGIVDPDFLAKEAGYSKEKLLALVQQDIQQNVRNDGAKLNVLLAHRPELLEIYAACHVDLAFSGHAHGGQVRLPFVGGLIAPHQGFFPKYTSGLHVLHDTTMVISRGLGNSVIPLRLFNRPELVVVTLKRRT